MNGFIIVIIFLIISIIISFGIGANDETFATIYGSRILNMKQILILTTIFAILGAFFLGRAVSETVGKNTLLIEITPSIVLTILISTAVWLIVSSSFGLPISTTHATIGAIIGIGLYLGGFESLNWLNIMEMSIWWILSPLIGFLTTFIAYKILHKYKSTKINGFKDLEKMENTFSYIVLAVICLTAFSRAGNDCSNAVGIVYGIGEIDLNILLIITGLSLASGIIVLGRFVIKNVGNITELRPSTAFAAEVPTAVILFMGTLLGIPLSGSHMLVASLIALSISSRSPRQKGTWKILTIWILTFPIAAILSIGIYMPVSSLI